MQTRKGTLSATDTHLEVRQPSSIHGPKLAALCETRSGYHRQMDTMEAGMRREGEAEGIRL